MAKRKFVKTVKEIKKSLTPVLMQSGARIAGNLGTKAVSPMLARFMPAYLAKHQGALLFVVGTALDVAVRDDNVRAVGQGVAIEGAMQMGESYLPETIKSKVGLSGLGMIDDVEFEELAREAELLDEMESGGAYEPYTDSDTDEDIEP